MALLTGCVSPMGPNQAGGAIAGGASGAILGGAISHSGEGVLIGGVIGTLAGALVGKDIDESTRTHVVQGQPLAIEDIKNLSKANVGDDLIISQINMSRTVYHLNTAQIIDLRNAGISAKVIDYMINTPTAFVQPPAVSRGDAYYYSEPVAPYPYYYYYPAPRFYVGPFWHGRHWHR